MQLDFLLDFLLGFCRVLLNLFDLDVVLVAEQKLSVLG